MNNPTIADIPDSVKAGEVNQKVVINFFVKKFYPDCTFVEMPQMSVYDYSIIKNGRILANIEVKIRSRHFSDTAVPFYKFAHAVMTYSATKIKTYYLSYCLETKHLSLYDLMCPCRFAEMTRRDRGVTGEYAYYTNGKIFHVGEVHNV